MAEAGYPLANGPSAGRITKGLRVRLVRDVRRFRAGDGATVIDTSGVGWATLPYVVEFDDGIRTNLAADDVEWACTQCDMPMHRYGFPADLDGHMPSYVACVNSLRAELHRLRADAVVAESAYAELGREVSGD